MNTFDPYWHHRLRYLHSCKRYRRKTLHKIPEPNRPEYEALMDVVAELQMAVAELRSELSAVRQMSKPRLYHPPRERIDRVTMAHDDLAR